MSKKLIALLVVTGVSAVVAVAGERGASTTEIAKIVSFFSFVLAVFLFATRHQSTGRVAEGHKRGAPSDFDDDPHRTRHGPG